jgi:two-component system, OmpR family, alkaline phosphatase synthesis response regulator PhoP
VEDGVIWLIAEDEADILNLVATMCQVWGHSPMTFESGQKVWNWLDDVEAGKFTGKLPEFVLMDIRMPGKRGNEVANRMRTVSALKEIPIALMTANSLSSDEKKAIMTDDGADQILSKPLPTFDELHRILNQIIHDKRASTQRSEPA